MRLVPLDAEARESDARVHASAAARIASAERVTCRFVCTSDYGPDRPTGTPPGARTTAIVTPSMTRVGCIIASAPSRSALSKASRQSATCTVKLLPGGSDGVVCRIPPPPLSEYAKRWYPAPSGVGIVAVNVQPRTLEHQPFVASGLELAS